MFIKKLWVFNKKAAIFFMLFIISWCYINVKQGAVATPILQYGMYSNNYFLKDTQNVLNLYVNDKKIDFTKYSISERDQLQIYADNYKIQKVNNEMVFTTMKRILSKVYLGNFMTINNYTCNISDKEFIRWYTKIIEKITHQKVVKLEAYYQKYLWQSSQLVAVSTPFKII